MRSAINRRIDNGRVTYAIFMAGGACISAGVDDREAKPC